MYIYICIYIFRIMVHIIRILLWLYEILPNRLRNCFRGWANDCASWADFLAQDDAKQIAKRKTRSPAHQLIVSLYFQAWQELSGPPKKGDIAAANKSSECCFAFFFVLMFKANKKNMWFCSCPRSFSFWNEQWCWTPYMRRTLDTSASLKRPFLHVF